MPFRPGGSESMKDILIAIVTKDPYYGEALSRALRKTDRRLSTQVYDSRVFLDTWTREGSEFRNSFDLILWDGEEVREICSKDMIWLTDRREQGACSTIYKYNTATSIAAEIREIHAALYGERPERSAGADARIVAFSSWQGGCGCSTVAFAVGQDLVRSFGKRVLYVSLEDFEATSDHVRPEENEVGMGEYIYRLFHGGKNPPGLERHVVSDPYGLNILAPSPARNPMVGLRKKEMDALVGSLASSGFDAILVDVGNGSSDGDLAAMKSADVIVTVESRSQEERRGRYEEWLAENLEKERDKRIKRINVINSMNEGAHTERTNHNSSARADNPMGSGDIVLGVNPTLSMGMRDEILLEGRFGADIHALAEMIWYNKIE